jgi:predicted O-methyltransferase YrrM
MSTGPWQGSLLSFLIKLHRPKFALELGTLYGYSTMCIAHAMGRGHLITVDSSIKSTNQASQTFKQFELHYPQSTKITAQCSKAADFLQTYADKCTLMLSLNSTNVNQ